MEYRIVTAGAEGPGPERVTEGLQEKVNRAIFTGWEPIGGVTFGLPDCDGASPFLYACQAMVKRG